MTRRQAITTAGTTAGMLWAGRPAWAGANDRVRVAIAGMGGRGNDLLKETSSLANVEVGMLIDPDGNRTESAAKVLLDKTGKRAKLSSDLRHALEDKEIDALLISTCNHWHALAAIWACQAGKDVYVEKPVSHNYREGVKIVEAARKYKRVVQGGTQRRSYGWFRRAMGMLHAGAIGDIYQAKWFFPGRRDSIGFESPSTPPAWLNWDKWLGPAPEQPYHKNLVHYNWHWFWDFGNGELGNNGIHLVDISRWGMKKGLPARVYSTGGRYGYKDQAQTPNTQTVTWRYDDGTEIIGEIRGLYTGEPMTWDFFGSKGHMRIHADGKFDVVMGRNKEKEPAVEPLAEVNHMENFVEAVRSRRWQDLNAEVEQTHLSTALCHLGNISYRLGREVRFDAGKGAFAGDAEADAMLTRKYRAPYVVPEQV